MYLYLCLRIVCVIGLLVDLYIDMFVRLCMCEVTEVHACISVLTLYVYTVKLVNNLWTLLEPASLIF